MSSRKVDPPDAGGGGENHGMTKKVDSTAAGAEEDEEEGPICVITATTTVGATGSGSEEIDGEKEVDDGSNRKSEGQPENKKDSSTVASQNSKQSASTSSPSTVPASELDNNHPSSSSTDKSTEKSGAQCASSRKTLGSSSSSISSSSSKNINSSSKSLEVKKPTTSAVDAADDDNGLVEKNLKPTSIQAQQTSKAEQDQSPKQQHNRFLKKVSATAAPSASSSSTNQTHLSKDKPKEVMAPVKPHIFKKPAVPPPTPPPPPPPTQPSAPLYGCPKCDLEFTTRSILNTHLNDAHPIVRKVAPVVPPPKLEAENSNASNGTSSSSAAAPTGPPYDCPECNHRFPNPFQLKKHSIIHNKPLQCPLCPQTYLAMEALNLHKRYIHDSSKLHWFKCQICGKSDFLLLSDLYTHRVESHPEIEWQGEREKPFGCGICQRPFLRKGDALVCAVLGHEAGQIYEQMFQWKCSECPEDMLGFWRVDELRGHWEEKHNDKEMPEEVIGGDGGNGGQLPCVQIDKREAYDLKEKWSGEDQNLILEFDLLAKKGGRRKCEIPVFGCPDCLLTFVDVESLRIHEKVHLRDEGPPMPSPVRKRGRPSSKTERNGGGEGQGNGKEGKVSAGILQMMGSPDKHQEPISLVEENGGVRGKHLIPKYDCQVCGKRFRKLKRLRDHEQYHKMKDPNCPVFPKVMGRGGRKKGSGGQGSGGGVQGKTAMQKSIAHAGGILRKRGRGRPKKVQTFVEMTPKELEIEDDEEEEGEDGGDGEGEGMEWWEEALLDEEDEMEFKCGLCDAAFHVAKQLRMHELAAHNAPHRKPGRKPRGMGVNGGEGEYEEKERLVEVKPEILKKKKKRKVRGEEEDGGEVRPVRPGKIKVGRLEISTKLNKEIKDSVPIRLSLEGRGEDGRKGPQYKCPKCPKEFRDKRGIHLHILGHSLNGPPGEKQRGLDEEAGDYIGEEEEMEGERGSNPGEIGGERRTSDRERKVPRKLSDFEVEDGGDEEDDQRMEVDAEEIEVKVKESPPPPSTKVIEAPGPQVKVSEVKKKMALPREFLGEVVKNMTILQAEGKKEEKKEVPVSVSASAASFEKISEKIVGMKKDQVQKKKLKLSRGSPQMVPVVKNEVEGGPPVPDYYGEGQGQGSGGAGDKVTCQTCLKTFDSVEVLWYHCSQEHFNKGGKVKYIPKAVAAPVIDTPVEGEAAVAVKKELKTYGSAKKIAFLSLLDKRRESQCPSPPKAGATETEPAASSEEVPVEEIKEPSEVPASATVTEHSEVTTKVAEAEPSQVEIPATVTVANATEAPEMVKAPSQVPAPVKVAPTRRPPPPALIPLNTNTGRDNSTGVPPQSPSPSTSQQKNKYEASPVVPVQAPAPPPPTNNVDKLKTSPPRPSPTETVKVSEPAKVTNKPEERRISIETPKSKPEVKVTPNPAEPLKVTPSKPVLKNTPAPPPEVKTPKVAPPPQPTAKNSPSEVKTSTPKISQPQPVPRNSPPEVKTSPPKMVYPSAKKTPEALKPSPTPPAKKPEVTKTFTIKSNPDLSISIVKTRPTQQVFSSTSSSSSSSTQEPKPEVSISLVKARQQQMQLQHQQIMSKPPSQLSVSLVKTKVAHVPVPSQFPKTVPNFKLSELIRCASKKHPLIQPQLQQQQQAPQLPKLSRPPPLTPAPVARASSPPKVIQRASPSSQLAVGIKMPTPPKLEETTKQPQVKRKIIVVNKSSLMSSPTSPPKKLEETSLKKVQTTPSPSLKPSPKVAPGTLRLTFTETWKKKVELNQVISPPAPKPAIPPIKLEETLKKKTEIQKAPPKVEETQETKVPKDVPPKMEAIAPKKKIIIVRNPSAEKMEETLKKQEVNPVIPPPAAPAATPKSVSILEETFTKLLENVVIPPLTTPKALPKFEETLKKKQDNQQVSPSQPSPPKLKEKMESPPVKIPPQKLEETQKKSETKPASPPAIKPATSIAPPKLEETSVQKKSEKIQATPQQSVIKKATPKLEEIPKKPEIKKLYPSPAKPAAVQAPAPAAASPKLEESSVQPKKVEKSQVASKQSVTPTPAPSKMEEPLNKVEETQNKKISLPTKPADPTPPPKQLEEAPKTQEDSQQSISTPPPVPPKALEESPKNMEVPSKLEEESTNQSAASSLSSARVVASAPLSKSTSSTENPTTPLQVSSNPLQKPPLSSPTANEFRFKIIKQSVILPFKKRTGRPSPKYLEYLEGKQKSSSKTKAVASTSKNTSTLLKSQSTETLQTQQESSGENPPNSKKIKLSEPTPSIIPPETQPTKIEPTETTPVTADPPIKRKRGRPWLPKNLLKKQAAPIPPPSSNGTGGPPVKRKRGRPWPPKVPPTTTPTTSTPNPPSTPPRIVTKPSSISPDITTCVSRRKISVAPAPEVTPNATLEPSLSTTEDPPPLQAIEVKPKGKPGRPRIHPVVVKDPSAPKRGRGRPSKSSLSLSTLSGSTSTEGTSPNGSMDVSMNDSSILSSSATSAGDTTLDTEGEGTPGGQTSQNIKKRGRPFKKRRGRQPYKSVLPVNQAAAMRRHSTSSAVVVPPVGGGGIEKRGRGRPRKSMPILTPAVD